MRNKILNPIGGWFIFSSLVFSLSLFLYRLLKWIYTKFGGVTSDQFIFHAFANLDGVPREIILSFIYDPVAKPLIALVISLIIFSIVRSKLWSLVFVVSQVVVSVALMTAVAARYWSQDPARHVSAEFKSQNASKDWIAEFYIQPKVRINPKYNVLWVYIESLEPKHAVDSGFKPDFRRGVTVPFVSLSGTGWTHAGVMASQCGVPYLMLPGSDRSTHLKRATCMTDVMAKLGYKIRFVGGAAMEFSNGGDFLQAHSIQRSDAIGTTELRKLLAPTLPDIAWGYGDTVLMDFAERDILNIHRSGEKYFYILQTIDTHGPHGMFSPRCAQQGFKNTHADIYRCTLSRVDRLLRSLKEAGVFENTALVLMGDHPLMRSYKFTWNDTLHDLAGGSMKASQHDVYAYMWSPKWLHQFKSVNTSALGHFDIYPSVFSLAGGDFEQDGAGLGRNIFELPSLLDRYSINEFNYLLTRKSDFYESLWR